MDRLIRDVSASPAANDVDEDVELGDGAWQLGPAAANATAGSQEVVDLESWEWLSSTRETYSLSDFPESDIEEGLAPEGAGPPAGALAIAREPAPGPAHGAARGARVDGGGLVLYETERLQMAIRVKSMPAAGEAAGEGEEPLGLRALMADSPPGIPRPAARRPARPAPAARRRRAGEEAGRAGEGAGEAAPTTWREVVSENKLLVCAAALSLVGHLAFRYRAAAPVVAPVVPPKAVVPAPSSLFLPLRATR